MGFEPGLIAFLGALVAGIGIGWALARLGARSTMALEVARAEARLAQGVSEAGERAARLEATLESERASHAEQLRVSQDLEGRFERAFKALAGEALSANQAQFLSVATRKLDDLQGQTRLDLDARRQGIEDLLRPMKETLAQVSSTITQVEQSRREDYGHVAEQLVALNRETDALGRALRAPQTRGRWGEMQLQRVVELAGMQERCDFDTQVSIQGDTGLLRPDMIIHLPGNKTIVIDAKVPLLAYLDASAATDDAGRQAKLRDHAAQVRAHIESLRGKAYWQQFPNTPEFVVMFLPGEAFFAAALEVDPALLEFGAKNHVIAASPLTLLALLRVVAEGWKHEALAENAQAIKTIGRELYDRLGTMAEHLVDLRRKIEGAVDAYNKTVGSLEARVLPHARRLKDLGLGADAELAALEPVDRAPRRLQAPELAGPAEGVPVDAVVVLDTGRSGQS